MASRDCLLGEIPYWNKNAVKASGFMVVSSAMGLSLPILQIQCFTLTTGRRKGAGNGRGVDSALEM